MTERKVASRQERLMFEKIIRQDMQSGIQRSIPNGPKTPNTYPQSPGENQIQNQEKKTPNLNLNEENKNKIKKKY